jgi:hypothetical protein
MIHQFRLGGLVVFLVLGMGIWGLSACLDPAKKDEEPAVTANVSGTWIGSNISAVTISGGCDGGGGSGMDDIYLTAVQQQGETTVTGTVMADSQSFAITAGTVSGSTFTFGVDMEEPDCAQLSLEFSCTAQSDTLFCTSMDTHCDHCINGLTTHTVQETYNFTKQ